MKKIIFPLLLSFSTCTVFCQQDSLLKKFRFRIDNFRAVNFNINGGGNYSKFDLVSGSTKSSSSSGVFGTSYFTSKSTDRILLTATSNFNSSFFAGKTNSPNQVDKSKGYSVSPAFAVLNKWYAKKRFIELGADLQANFHGNNNKQSSNPGPFKNSESYYSIAINTGIGSGRLENITDMQNALWLYKELTASKSLVRALTPDELNELGRAITKSNNTRVLDSRKRTQFVLTTVDDYLQQKQLIAKTDITYFTTLNDILFFAFNTPRFSGTEKYIRFTPALSGSNRNQTESNLIDKDQHRFNTQSLLLSIGFSKYVPVNLVHQNNYGGSIKLSTVFTDLTDRYFTNGNLTNETKGTGTLKQAGVNLFFQHALYPK